MVTTTSEPRARNAFLDAVRAVALIRIMVWHTYGYAWLSYLIASMPAMFFVAGSLMARSLQRGNALDVLYRRFRRLLLPFWAFGIVALLIMSLQAGRVATSATGLLWWIAPGWDPTGTEWGLTLTVPLWYLRCLTWLLIASPILVWFWRHVGPALLLLPLAALALIEAGNLPESGLPWQLHDIALFSFFWMLGFAYTDGFFARFSALARGLACAACVAAAAVWVLTQDVPGGIVNSSYPLHLFVGLAWLFGALSIEQTIARVAVQRRVAAVLTWLNSRALTIYLWQTVGLLTMYQILWAGNNSAFLRTVLALPIVVSVTFVAVLLFGWLERMASRRSGIRISGWRLPSFSGNQALAAGGVASFGVAAILAALILVARDPSTLVQVSSHTVPPSGAGLHYRAQKAEIVSAAPIRPLSGRTDPVTSKELQAELEVWLGEWGLKGATVSLRRETGETWTGVAGLSDAGETFNPDEPYWIASVTKTFTTALILRLVDTGQFELDDTVSRFVPDFPNSDRFTIRQLLQHTSGLTSDSEEPYRALEEAAVSGLQFEPGTDYLYSRAGYYLLALIVEDVLGTSFTDALRDQILNPLGLSSTAMDEEQLPVEYSTHPYSPENASGPTASWTQGGIYLERMTGDWDYHGVLWSAGGLWSTTKDLTRWALALWNSDLVLAPHSRHEMTTFLDERFDFTGLGTYPFCACWRDQGVLLAERWGFAGTTGILEFDPEDRIAIAVHISGTLFDENAIDALEDFSVRMRRLVRGREFLVDASLPRPVLGSYLVQEGDTLYDIASRLGIPEADQAGWVDDVISMNNIDESGALEIGLELRLPGD